MSSSPSSLSLWRRFLLPLTPRTTLPRSRGPMHCGSRCEWAYIRVRLRFLMGGTSVSTCITRSGLARSLAEDRSFYLRRRRRRSGKETGTISRFGRSAPSSSRAFPLPSLFMNSLRPSHQRDACPRSLHNHAHPALRMSSSGRSRMIRPPQLDKAEGGKSAQGAVYVLSARCHEACKGLL